MRPSTGIFSHLYESYKQNKAIPAIIGTRPDTRPIPVADGWAGAEMRVFALSQLDHHGPTNQPTDQPTDRPTDRRTKPLIELRVRN